MTAPLTWMVAPDIRRPVDWYAVNLRIWAARLIVASWSYPK